MNPTDILSRNHDIHMHSVDFSDGIHPALDVVRHASRWQAEPRWVGLSDHNPLEPAQAQLYIRGVHDLHQESFSRDGITILAGMELDWTPVGPTLVESALTGLDYGLAAYHGKDYSTAEQVENYFGFVSNHLYTDVVAHPDRFLGGVDTLSINWEQIFNNFKSHENICEYNLTTPLRPEILAVAMERTNVNFIIGSDTHDFRSIAVRRIIDAWSESLGGGYEIAREYLINLLKMACSRSQINTLSQLFSSSQLLDKLQSKVFLRSLNPRTNKRPLLNEENLLVNILESIPECSLDKDFLIHRFDRFSRLPEGRIKSLLNVNEFLSEIKGGRQIRVNQ